MTVLDIPQVARRPGAPGLHLARVAAWDALAVALILLVALPGAWPLLGAQDLVTGAGDWHAQAFRVRDLLRQGFATWTHDWAGGLPLWSAYQMAPHLLMAGAVQVTGAAETRVMAAAQGVLLLWLPLNLYGLLRRGGLGVRAALIGALMVLALDTRRQATANFTELWGIALGPLLLAGAYATAGRRRGYLLAAGVGAAIYVHPLAWVIGCMGLLAAAVVRAPRTRGGAARAAGALAGQGAVVVAVAGFFLLPAFASARPAYEHAWFSSAAFEQMLARLAVSSWLVGWPLWLGAAAGCVALVAVRGDGEARRRAVFLLGLGALIGVMVLPALAGWGPRAFLNAQTPRLLSYVPLLVAAGVALAVDLVGRRASIRRGGARDGWWAVRALHRAGPGVVGGLVALLAVVAAGQGPELGTAREDVASPLTAWLRTAEVEGRVALPADWVAEPSYAAYGRQWYTSSYSGQEWSIMGGPLASYLDGFGTAATRSDYLTALGVELAVVPAGVRPAIVQPLTGEAVVWEEVAALPGVDVLRLPWQAPLAGVVDGAALAGAMVPDLPFWTVDEAYPRDVGVARYARLMLSAGTAPVAVAAGSSGALELRVTDVAAGGVLVVGVNWDRAWRAEADGRTLPVRRVGPNHVGVDLGDLAGREGTVAVRLTHGTPATWWYGGALVALGLVLAGGLAWRGARWR